MSEPLPDMPDYCWPVDPGCLPKSWGDIGTAMQDRAIALATASLYRLTLGRVGGCPITVRPCPVPPSPDAWRGYLYSTGRPWMSPSLVDGTWINCACASGCGCTTGCEIHLPGYVGRVDEIKVDGSTISEADYEIVDHAHIVYTGSGACPFPKSQNLALPSTEVGTLEVTYLPSHPVDGLGAVAAGTLAAEFAKACCGDDDCRLPSGTTSVVRQGISIEVVSGMFPNGTTGIDEVDTYIALWNPKGAEQLTQVWSPDMPSARVYP